MKLIVRTLFAIVALTQLALSQAEVDKSQFKILDPIKDPGFTGDLSISLPVMTVPGRDGLDFPIVINFHHDTRATRKPTWVGLDWNLQVGSITRSVNNIPDDQHSNMFVGQGSFNLGSTSMIVDQLGSLLETDGALFGSIYDVYDSYYLNMPEGSHSLVPITDPNGVMQFQLQDWKPWNVWYGGWDLRDGNENVRALGPNWNDPGRVNSFISSWLVRTEEGASYTFSHENKVSFLTGQRSKDPAGNPNTCDPAHLEFPISWDLASILSANYVDRNHNGIVDQGDDGGWVLIGYNNYANSTYSPNRRINLGNGSTIAAGPMGNLTLFGDVWGGVAQSLTVGDISYNSSAVPGTLEYDYSCVSTIETPTHIAVFGVADRTDFVDNSASPSVAAKQLRSIILYKKRGGSRADTTRVKKVLFTYSNGQVLASIQEFGRTDADSLPAYRFQSNGATWAITYPEGATETYEFESDLFSWYNTRYLDRLGDRVSSYNLYNDNFKTFFFSSALNADSTVTGSSGPMFDDMAVDRSGRIKRKTVTNGMGIVSQYQYQYGEGVLSTPGMGSDRAMMANFLSLWHGGTVGYRWVDVILPDSSKKRTYYTSNIAKSFSLKGVTGPSVSPVDAESYPNRGALISLSGGKGALRYEDNSCLQGQAYKEEYYSSSGSIVKTVLNEYPIVDQNSGSSSLADTAMIALHDKQDGTVRYISDDNFFVDRGTVYALSNYQRSYIAQRFLHNIHKSGWLPLMAKQTTQDSATSTVRFEYNTTNGLPFETQENNGSSSAEGVRYTKKTFAYEQNGEMYNRNMLTQEAITEVGTPYVNSAGYSYGNQTIPAWSCGTNDGMLQLNSYSGSEQWCQLSDRPYQFDVSFDVNVSASNQGGVGFFFRTFLLQTLDSYGNTRVHLPPTISYPDSAYMGYLFFVRFGYNPSSTVAKTGIYRLSSTGDYSPGFTVDRSGPPSAPTWIYFAQPSASSGFTPTSSLDASVTHTVRVVGGWMYDSYVPVKVYIDNQLFYSNDSLGHGSVLGVLSYHCNAQFNLHLEPVMTSASQFVDHQVDYWVWKQDSLTRWMPANHYRWLSDSSTGFWQGPQDLHNICVEKNLYDSHGLVVGDVDANGVVGEKIFDQDNNAVLATVKNSLTKIDTTVLSSQVLVDMADRPFVSDDFDSGTISTRSQGGWRFAVTDSIRSGKLVVDGRLGEAQAVLSQLNGTFDKEYQVSFDMNLTNGSGGGGVAFVNDDQGTPLVDNAGTPVYVGSNYYYYGGFLMFLGRNGTSLLSRSFTYCQTGNTLNPPTWNLQYWNGGYYAIRKLDTAQVYHVTISGFCPSTDTAHIRVSIWKDGETTPPTYQYYFYRGGAHPNYMSPMCGDKVIFYAHNARMEVDNVRMYGDASPDTANRYITYNDTTVTLKRAVFFDDFEEGLANWETTSPSSLLSSTTFLTGVQSMTLGQAAGNVQSNRSANYISLPSPTEDRVLAYYVKTQGAGSGTVGSVVEFYNTGHSHLSDATALNYGGTADWSYGEQRVTPPAGAAYAKIKLLINGGSGSAWFDNVKFYPARGALASVQYDPAISRPISIVSDGGVVTRYQYDGLGRLIGTYDMRGSKLQDYSYTYSRSSASGIFNSVTPNTIGQNAYLDNINKITHRSYFDALGNHIQDQQNVGSDDIVSATDLDIRFRPLKSYKAFQVTQGNPHTYDSLYLSQSISYYAPISSGVGNYPYSQAQYFSDFLGRKQKDAAPGSNYIMGSGKERKYEYGTNLAQVPGYATGSLSRSRTTDEDGRVGEQFKDAFGKVVASTSDVGSSNLQTFFEYDLLGNLLRSTSPKGLQTTYAYDTFSRMRTKVSPDAGKYQALYDMNGNARLIKDANHLSTAVNSVSVSATRYSAFNQAGSFAMNLPGHLTFSARLEMNDGGSPSIQLSIKNAAGIVTIDSVISNVEGYNAQHTIILPQGTYSYVATGSSGGEYDYAISCPTGFEFVYNKYDALNRLTEQGEYESSSIANFTQANANNASFPSGGVLAKTSLYDVVSSDPLASGQHNLRGRLSMTKAYKWGAEVLTSSYSYDERGRLEWMVQSGSGVGSSAKKFYYAYDFQGNVLQKTYQDLGNSANNLCTIYAYDPAGRLWRVYDSTAAMGRMQDAEYSYFAAGSVKRSQLGFAQGMDYRYNSRDWLTSINHQNLNSSQDPGGDGANGLPVDRFGEILDYDVQNHIGIAQNATPQYAGNISWMIYAMSGVNYTGPKAATGLLGWSYGYDRLNRLAKADFGYYCTDPQTQVQAWWPTEAFDIKRMSYDADGNIDTLNRYNKLGAVMDSLKYNYAYGTNRLSYVTDRAPGSAAQNDVDNQASGNYQYDANGNMTQDLGNQIACVQYDIDNLPIRVWKTSGQILDYVYDVKGMRIQKSDGMASTYYVNGADEKTDLVQSTASGVVHNLHSHELLGQVKMLNGSIDRYYYLKDHLGSVRMTVNGGTKSFSENFGSGTLSQWNRYLYDGFTCSTGYLRDQYPGSQSMLLNASGTVLSDGFVAVDVWFNQIAEPSASFLFRAQDQNFSYAIQLHPTQLVLTKRYPWTETTVSSGAIPALRTDGLPNRMMVTAVGGIITVYWNGAKIIQYSDGSPWTSGRVGFLESGNVVTWDNVWVGNNLGAVASYDDFDPWGLGMEGRSGVLGQPDARFKFTEKERDVETGYDYFGARYYDSRIGRWMAVDPMAEKYAAWSPYNYCINSPTLVIDPHGDTVRIMNAALQKKHDEYYKRNADYRARFDRLNGSEIVYNVNVGDLGGMQADGTIKLGDFSTKDGKTIDITVDADRGGDINEVSHEFVHGDQFQRGEITMIYSSERREWFTYNITLGKEAEAFRLQLRPEILSTKELSKRYPDLVGRNAMPILKAGDSHERVERGRFFFGVLPPSHKY